MVPVQITKDMVLYIFNSRYFKGWVVLIKETKPLFSCSQFEQQLLLLKLLVIFLKNKKNDGQSKLPQPIQASQHKNKYYFACNINPQGKIHNYWHDQIHRLIPFSIKQNLSFLWEKADDPVIERPPPKVHILRLLSLTSRPFPQVCHKPYKKTTVQLVFIYFKSKTNEYGDIYQWSIASILLMQRHQCQVATVRIITSSVVS